MTRERELDLYTETSDCDVCSDVGGVWMVVRTKGKGHRLWHINQERERDLYAATKGARMCSDGVGGVWTICNTKARGYRL